jgi:hypothetical protein
MNDAFNIHKPADFDPFHGNPYFTWAAAQTKADRKSMRSWTQDAIAEYFRSKGYSFVDFQTLSREENRFWKSQEGYVYPGDEYPPLPEPSFPMNLSLVKAKDSAWSTPVVNTVQGNPDAVIGGST